MITGRLPFHGQSYEELFDAILKKDVVFPSSVSEPAKVHSNVFLMISLCIPLLICSLPPFSHCVIPQSIVSGLLAKHPDNRLGGSARDGRDVMAHAFFAGINFDKLVRREIKPPFVPVVTSELDCTNFDPTFTSEVAKLTPPSASLAKEEEEVFEGFQTVVKK